MNHHEKQAHRVGPGGYKCPCCGPAPGARKKHRRLVRRRMKASVAKTLEEMCVITRCLCGEGDVIRTAGQGVTCTNCGDQWA